MNDRERDLQDEMRSHLDMAAQERIERGEAPADAKRAAEREFGNRALVQEVTREMWPWRRLEETARNLRYAARSLARSRGFTPVAILTMALGIGATTAVFSVTQTVLLRPLPYADPERLVWIHDGMTSGDRHGWSACMADFLLWKTRTRSFEALAAIAYNGFAVTGEGEAEQVIGAAVSAQFFEVLGARPLLGRTFASDEDRPGGTPTVVIGEKLWRRRYKGDAAIIGKPIVLNGRTLTVIGVMPAAFHFRQRDAEVWAILPLNRPNRRGPFFLNGVARLKRGATLETARAELDVLGREVEAADSTGVDHARYPVFPLRDDMVGDVRQLLLVLTGAVVFVLFIAILNVANLMLARAGARRREVAIRLSVGAGRAQLVRQFLTESVLLACAGGALGLLLAHAGVTALRAAAPPGLPRIEEIAIDARALWQTLAISILSGVLFGLAPALAFTGLSLGPALQEGGRTAGDGRRKRRLRAVLVTAEVAMAVMLLAGAGLLIRSFSALNRVTTGLTTPPQHVLAMTVMPIGPKYRETPRLLAYWRDVLERTRALPGVESAGLTITLPPDQTAFNDGFEIPGKTPPEGGPNVPVPFIAGDYFQALGIPILRGRTFNAGDTSSSPKVTIISETLARRYFPGEDPIGRKLKHGGPALKNPYMEIVGVAGDVKYEGLDEPTAPVYYESLMQNAARPMWLVLRTRGDAAAALPAVRDTLRGIDPNAPISHAGTMTQLLYDSVALPRFRTTVMAIFAFAALALAAVGIYGLVSYSVAQRTQEIGIRMALGASSATVLRMVVQQGSTLAAIGVAVGLAGAIAEAGALRTLLFGVGVRDAAALAAAAGGLILVAVLASYIPARRAAALDPLQALKHE